MADANARECRAKILPRSRTLRRPRPWGEVRYGDHEAWGYVEYPRETVVGVDFAGNRSKQDATRERIPPQETEGGHG